MQSYDFRFYPGIRQPVQPYPAPYGPIPYRLNYGAFPGYWGRAPQPELSGGPESMGERPPHAARIDWSSRYPNEVILHGPHVQEVSLTFDDGPDDQWTPQVLDDLRDSGVKATFFCVGRRIEANPDVFRRIVAEGHVVGNHSWDHPNFAKIPLSAVRDQIERTDDIMNRLAGVRPHLLRPPYGSLSEDVIEEAIRLNKLIILWNVDSLDWTQITAEQVAANILSHAGPGSIILQHSAGGVGESLQNTVNALPYVIGTMRKQGFAFRTVPELLGVPAYL